MKRSILYLLFITSGFYSCQNTDDSVFEESADARINKVLASYEKQLVDAPNGWNAVMYPAGGGSYGFYFKFDNKNRVIMYSDFAAASAATAKESSYRLKAMQTPSLIFDTYSYLHVLSDPDAEVNGGTTGEGLLSDFEFAIYPDSVKTDAITFVGRKNQSRLVLTKATPAQATAYTSGEVAKSIAFNNISKYLTYFKRVTIAGITYEMSVNQADRTIKLTWLEGTAVRTFTSGYYFRPGGLALVKPFVNGNQTISGFTNITWNATALQIGLTVNGTATAVVNAARPLAVDVAAARRWWNDPLESGGDWRTWDGFHVNGVDNAFGINKLTADGKTYAFYVFQPGGPGFYDVLAPAFSDGNSLSLVYANIISTAFTADGRAIFTVRGVSGANAPTSGPFIDTQNLFAEPTGYYFIQTSASTYDMVSAKDARSWISWF
jgi:hypothetical protein